MLFLTNVYGPNETTPRIFFLNDLNNFSSNDVISGGDFNLILNNDFDKIGGAFQHSNYKSCEIVCSQMRTMNLSNFFVFFIPI